MRVDTVNYRDFLYAKTCTSICSFCLLHKPEYLRKNPDDLP